MRRIMYNLDLGFAGCNEEDEMEISDDMNEMEIDDMVQSMALEYASSWEGDCRLGWDSEMTEEENEEQTAYFYENISGTWRFIEDDD